MKNLFLATTVLALFAILGIALAGTTVDKSPKEKEALAKASPSCCQDELSSENTASCEDVKSECCAAGLVAVPAKEAACSSDACQTDDAKKACAQCCTAGAVATAKPAAKACEQCTEDCEEECESCAEDRKAVASQQPAGKACEECSEDCERECESCAEARKVASSEKPSATAAQSNPKAPGLGMKMGMGHGHAGDDQHAKDHQDFFFLIEHREKIQRTVTNLPNGVATLTESDQPEVSSMIQTHVEAMYARLEHKNPIRMRDPIFRAVFSHADKIKMELEHTDHGVRVKETSDDEYVVKLIQEHAKVVSLWIENGYAELPKNHAAPQR